MNLFAILIALSLYAETFVVTDVVVTEPTTEMPYGTYTLILEDCNGNQWECETDDGDWFPGDVCTAIMSTNGTETIYDDEFVWVRYSGTIENYVDCLFPTSLT